MDMALSYCYAQADSHVYMCTHANVYARTQMRNEWRVWEWNRQNLRDSW